MQRTPPRGQACPPWSNRTYSHLRIRRYCYRGGGHRRAAAAAAAAAVQGKFQWETLDQEEKGRRDGGGHHHHPPLAGVD